MLVKFLLVVNMGLCSFIVDAQSAANLVIENYYKCEDVPNQKVNITVKPKTFSTPQVVDVTLITPVALGNEQRMSINVELEIKFGGKNNWQHIVTIEDDYCRVLQTYVGALAYDIEYSMGIPRGSCPISRGHYHAVNYTLNFNTFRLQAIPFGNLRTTSKVLEKLNRNVMSCTVFIMSNKN